jgi:hypothetical protein
MQAEEGTSSMIMMDPWSIFLYGMKAPMTGKIQRRARIVGAVPG